MPAGNTYTSIATQTLGSAAASVTFSSIPSTYTDLVLVISAQGASGASSAINAYFNTDTASNYSYTQLTGDGSSAASARNQDSTRMRLGWSAVSSAFAPIVFHIQNYSNTTTYKTSIGRINDAASITGAVVNLWRSTAAVNQIVMNLNSGANFNTGSTFSLYGIQSA
jgi:hypothetical protein